MKLDLLIMGSSRPHLLKYTYESFERYIGNLCQDTELRKLIHEDFIYRAKSNQSVKFAENNGFDVIAKHEPYWGLGFAMDYMFKIHIEADYIFYLQDDFEFERPVELDRILWVMERNKKINCITFNKYRNMKPNPPFVDKEYDYDGLKLCIYPGWQFIPGVWRMSKVREKWRPRKERPEGYWQNSFGNHEKRQIYDHLEIDVGAYMYGGLGEYRYVRHIGGTWRMADWQRENNNPGGVRHWDFQSLERDRSPWLGRLSERPLNPDIPLNDLGKELIENQPEYIKEMYKNEN